MWRRVHPRDWRRVNERAEGRTDGRAGGLRRREGVWYLRQAGAAGLPFRVCPGGVVRVDRFVLAGRHAHCWGGWRSGEERRADVQGEKWEKKRRMNSAGRLASYKQTLCSAVHSVPQKHRWTLKKRHVITHQITYTNNVYWRGASAAAGRRDFNF